MAKTPFFQIRQGSSLIKLHKCSPYLQRKAHPEKTWKKSIKSSRNESRHLDDEIEFWNKTRQKILAKPEPFARISLPELFKTA
jgi:hypothetical protein